MADRGSEPLLNYLYWLEDRGLKDCSRGAVDLQETVALDSASPVSPCALTKPLDLVIVTDELSESAERDMVQRIVLALGVEPRGYTIFSGKPDGFVNLTAARFLLVLGSGGSQLLASQGLHDMCLHELRVNATGPGILLIPHPRAMQAQPQLKIKAWEALQQLKAQLHQ